MDKAVSRWSPGVHYGPVLSQTDLYLLGSELELNPRLKGEVQDNPLQFHIVTGYSTNGQSGNTSVQGKDEPATLPRVNQVVLITRFSPWCTIVKKDTGVTIGDICSAVYKEYTENDISEAEIATLGPRGQDQIRRSATVNFSQLQPQPSNGPWGYYTPQQAPDRLRRVDWLRDRVYLDGLTKDDNYIKHRLGYKAPNIFVLDLIS